MIVVRYSEDSAPQEIVDVCSKIMQLTNEQVPCLPVDWDILFNCSTFELYGYKRAIEEIIRQKENAE